MDLNPDADLPAQGLSILAFAIDLEAALALLADQHQAKSQAGVQQVYRDYDQARDLDPDDSRPQRT